MLTKYRNSYWNEDRLSLDTFYHRNFHSNLSQTSSPALSHAAPVTTTRKRPEEHFAQSQERLEIRRILLLIVLETFAGRKGPSKQGRPYTLRRTMIGPALSLPCTSIELQTWHIPAQHSTAQLTVGSRSSSTIISSRQARRTGKDELPA